MTVTIMIGDVREQLRKLPDNSVHCIVTSPPYWGLRDYGTGTWSGGNPACEHKPSISSADPKNPGNGASNGKPSAQDASIYRGQCPCGAVREDRQIGLERTPAEFIATMVNVFEELRRVLRPDGTCWMNMGDSYATGAGKVNAAPGGGTQGERWKGARGIDKAPARGPQTQPNRMPLEGFKPKDIVMMPHRLAIALQDAGWWVRQDIVWSKPNPMPESVRDRCTKSHEYIFLLTKSDRCQQRL